MSKKQLTKELKQLKQVKTHLTNVGYEKHSIRLENAVTIGNKYEQAQLLLNETIESVSELNRMI